MRHLKKGRKLGREKGQRKALLNTLAVSLIQHGKIKTTKAKAKELRPFVEHLVTRGKHQDLQSIRHLIKFLPKDTAYRLYHEIAPRYADRNGGYTRIIKMAERRSNDGAEMATIEFV